MWEAQRHVDDTGELAAGVVVVESIWFVWLAGWLFLFVSFDHNKNTGG